MNDQIAELASQRDELLEALEYLLNIVDESRGVDGYHLNGEVAFWDEFSRMGELYRIQQRHHKRIRLEREAAQHGTD